MAYGLFVVGLWLACSSPAPLRSYLRYGSGLLLAIGIGCWLITAFLQTQPLVNRELNIQSPLGFFARSKPLLGLLLGQTVLFLISLVFFYFLETQTQINSRLYPIKPGYMVELIQQQRFGLEVIPWFFYSVLGVGLAYFSICLEKQPVLSRAIPINLRSKGGYFFFNLMSIVTDVVTIGPYVFIVSFTLVWLCEIINNLFGWDSLFLTPFRATFICALIILFFQKTNKQLIAWMKQYQVAIGMVFIIYIVAFTLFISWLHGFSGWLTSGQEGMISVLGAKSVLAGSYTEQSLHNRIQFLIWGWWSIWIPWMASLVARASVGFTLPRAFLHSILFPLVVFGWILPQLRTNGGLWENIFNSWGGQWLMGAGLLLFIWMNWKGQRTVGDVARGAMLPIGRLSKRPLNRWMMIVTLWLACYIPGWFLLGWLPLQIMVTLGGFFMMAAVSLFIGTWVAFLFRLLVAKKYKALESL